MHQMDDIPTYQSIPVGVMAVVASVSLSQINGTLALVATSLTCGVMGMRFWREIQYQREERRLCKDCEKSRQKKED